MDVGCRQLLRMLEGGISASLVMLEIKSGEFSAVPQEGAKVTELPRLTPDEDPLTRIVRDPFPPLILGLR